MKKRKRTLIIVLQPRTMRKLKKMAKREKMLAAQFVWTRFESTVLARPIGFKTNCEKRP